MKLTSFSVLFAAIGLLSSCLTMAQGSIPVLTWRSHFSYNQVIDITQSSDRVYAASPNGLFFVDKTELSTTKITKNDGISDVSIGAIGHASSTDVLVIAYTNGNIDLVEQASITNLRSFRDASLIGGKNFYDVSFNNGLAYLSSDQGILVISLNQKEIIESYQNLDENGDRLQIAQAAFFNNRIYAASPRGILSASLADGINRQDFNNWDRILTNLTFSGIGTDGNTLFAFTGENLYQLNNGQWELAVKLDEPIVDLDFRNSQVLLLTANYLAAYDPPTDITELVDLRDSQGTATTLLVDSNDEIWIGDGIRGLIKPNPALTVFTPTGPSSDNDWTINSLGDSIVVLHGGYSTQAQTLGREGKLSQFSPDKGWESSKITLGSNNDLFDLVDMEGPEEETSTFYLASFDRGLVRVAANETTVVNEASPNSTLEVMSGSVNMTALNSENSVIWMTNYGSSSPLHSWDPATDTWTAYNLANSRADYPIELYIAPNGDKWMPIDPERGGGIIVFNENSRTERYLNTNGGQGGLPGQQVTSLALDDDFFLWVGTNEGIAFYPNPGVVLDGNSLTASVPIFENRLLLRDEFITAIAIDPGNRKWFGTQNNGIWLFNETGEEQVYHFTTANSPLPSNQITSLYIQRESGELFIGTDKGLVSFRSDATEGTNQHENVKIFPNPAMRSNLNQIVINGLVNNALIKVTDVSGKLVKELRAQGSTALWNGRDYNGRLVSTGVYLVFSSNADGTETFVGKIAVI